MANVAREAAKSAGSKGEAVAALICLDPRSLLPLDVDVQKAFEQSGLTESLALLCQTLPGNEGQKYEDAGELLASLKDTATEDRDQAIRKALNSSALAALEHLHDAWHEGKGLCWSSRYE
eukprot:g1206.t1